MTNASRLVEQIASSNEVHWIDQLPEKERLEAYRELEAWAGLKADKISIHPIPILASKGPEGSTPSLPANWRPRHMDEGDDYVNEPRTGPVSDGPPGQEQKHEKGEA